MRSLSRAPGFAATAIVALALGIGATAAVFNLVHAVLLEPLPFPEPERLVWLEQENHRGGKVQTNLNLADVLVWREHSQTLEAVATYSGANQNLADEEEPIRLRGGRVSAGFLDVLGIRPLMGRGTVRHAIA